MPTPIKGYSKERTPEEIEFSKKERARKISNFLDISKRAVFIGGTILYAFSASITGEINPIKQIQKYSNRVYQIKRRKNERLQYENEIINSYLNSKAYKLSPANEDTTSPKENSLEGKTLGKEILIDAK